MKVFALIFALLALGSSFKIGTKKGQLIRLTKSNQCDPDGTTCPTGCCPEHNWFCCEDYCAPTPAECPFTAKRVSLVKLAKNKQCDPDETSCPGGCCPVPPELNWFCCDDFCAATAADCPFVAKKVSLVKMAKSRQCGPDETDCYNGWCCPEANWACCDLFCAPTAAECPFVAKQARLMNIAKNKQCGPDETSCPGGCCPEPNWYCCPDLFCAPTAADCPFEAKRAQLVKMAKSNQCDPDHETACPGGCCPMPNYVCCPCPTMYGCAATFEDCDCLSEDRKSAQLMEMAKNNRCGPDETFCHTACCPHPNWFCCDDVNFCAPTAADCP